jgi:hypothetical protein
MRDAAHNELCPARGAVYRGGRDAFPSRIAKLRKDGIPKADRRSPIAER